MLKNTKSWIFVEKGLKGTENQCIALADALELELDIKHPNLRAPWTWAAPFLKFGKSLAYKNGNDLFTPPFPPVVISAGRKSILAAMEIKRLSQDKTFVIHVLDPRISAKHFDLVIAPEHDPIHGENVISIQGALHRITPDFLNTYKGHYYDEISNLTDPKIAVLIGGSTTKSEFTTDMAHTLGKDLAKAAQNCSGSLLITASRRTGQEQENILRDAVKDTPLHFWDGQGENPYFDYLQSASYIIVTNDSVSMACEAMGSGKPVYIARIGTQGRRIERFHELLLQKNAVKPFNAVLEDWQPPQSNDMMRVCQIIKERFNTHQTALKD